MKLSQALCKQNIGWHFNQIWKVQQTRPVLPTKALEVLEKKGVPVVDANEVINPKKERESINIVGMYDPPQPLDETHPKWNKRTCLTYKDNDVLLEGLTQAKILTKTVEVQEGLPEKIQIQSLPKGINEYIRRIILASHVFDAEQLKLPKIKDPVRPAHIFARVYGITDKRANKLIVSRLLNIIEKYADQKLVRDRFAINDAFFSFPFEKSDELVQLQLTGDTFLTSSKPLEPVCIANTEDIELPNIFPIKETITLTPQNIYNLENVYPVSLKIRKAHPHTLFVHYNATEVKNLYEEEVTESQMFGRTLLKSFAVAASYAKQKYGENVGDLPEKVCVQCVQTDGRRFNFGIFQLNTLDLNNGNVKNVWFQTPFIPLFETCRYEMGKPVLKGYNNDVIKHLFAFYNNS